jgi:predicted SnoaL-like aldol condensation-catalyzing enzyme
MLKSVNLQLEENKKLVANLYQEIFGDKNIEAVDKYIGDNYIQHNPAVADGKEALKTALKVWFKGAPKEKIDIQHLGADGNFVYIHTRSMQGNKAISVMDIFRVDGNKVVEHWDVLQEVPAKAANDHPMF